MLYAENEKWRSHPGRPVAQYRESRWCWSCAMLSLGDEELPVGVERRSKKRNNGTRGWASSMFNVAHVHSIVTASWRWLDVCNWWIWGEPRAQVTVAPKVRWGRCARTTNNPTQDAGDTSRCDD